MRFAQCLIWFTFSAVITYFTNCGHRLDSIKGLYQIAFIGIVLSVFSTVYMDYALDYYHSRKKIAIKRAKLILFYAAILLGVGFSNLYFCNGLWR